MKIVCSKADLLKAVNIVSKAVPTRTPMTILECILIDATTDVVYLTANDMELGIQTSINARIEERGVIAIDAKIFSEIVRKLPDNDVTIVTTEDFKTTITCEKAKFNIVAKSGEDFSNIPAISRNEPVVISQYSLRETIRQTIFSIAENDNNKLMTGELFEINSNKLRIISLDGHRISIRNIELRDSYDYKKVVIPGKTLNEITKILNGGAEDFVNVFITDNHVIFEFDNTVVVSRLIEGEYFKVDQMISSGFETKMNINRSALLECIDRANLLVKEGDRKPIIFDVKDGVVELKISSFIGSLDEDISIEKEGKDIMIAFNPKFLMDALKNIEDETVSMYMLNQKAPCFIKNDNDDYNYIVLPINFNAVGY